MGKPRRRQAGEGGTSEYATKAGPRFLIKYPVLLEDGTKRVVLERGFMRRADAAAALRAEIRNVEMGEWSSPPRCDSTRTWSSGSRASG
jgi:hypothetical protein